jgi:hypothetical protein
MLGLMSSTDRLISGVIPEAASRGYPGPIPPGETDKHWEYGSWLSPQERFGRDDAEGVCSPHERSDMRGGNRGERRPRMSRPALTRRSLFRATAFLTRARP